MICTRRGVTLTPLVTRGTLDEEHHHRECHMKTHWFVRALVSVALLGISCGQAPSVSDTHGTKSSCRGGTPILLVPGFLAFSRVGDREYFQDVVSDLRSQGYCADVAVLPPVAPVPERAMLLRTEATRVMARFGAERIHLIAHSQGGLDSRWMISRLGGDAFVTSLTTIATPHRGCEISELVLGSDESARAAVARLFGVSLKDPAAYDNFIRTVHTLSPAWVRNIMNPSTPDMRSVRYESWAASAALPPIGFESLHPALFVTAAWLQTHVGANDGLVATDSMVWGGYQGLLRADHLAQIGHGSYNSAVDNFRHLPFYRAVASRVTSPVSL